MLRVSSLGLKRYHDASPSLLLQYCRSVHKLASHEMSERSIGRYDVPQEEKASSQRLSTMPTKANASESTGAEMSVPTGSPIHRRLAVVVIPPLRIQRHKKTPITPITQKTVDCQNSQLAPHVSHFAVMRKSITNLGDREVSPPIQHEDVSLAIQSDADASSLVKGHESLNRADLENIMATTAAAEEAWDAYQALMALPRRDNLLPIPYAHLHRLTRLLASTRPRTRALLLRLLSVLSTLHVTGGCVRVWQWNALIDCAGKGWRKTRLEDFKAALDVYEDMISGRRPGAAFSRSEAALAMEREVFDDAHREEVRPDIITFTTLMNIAGRTLQENALRRASSMLEASGLAPNRITHLALIRYYTRKNQLSGVRTTLSRMRDEGFELGIDGLNACIWAYARNGRLDVSSAVYRILLHRVAPEDDLGQDDIDTAVKYLYTTEALSIPEGILPDATTYYTLIQCYSYHGDLVRSLQVFMDMVSLSTRSSLTDGTEETDLSSPTLPAFRAIFLGFARHGTPSPNTKGAELLSSRLKSSMWTSDNLHALFQSFLKLPHNVQPSERTIFWVLMAFATTSGHDARKLRKVWEQLEERFGGGWGGRLERFRQRIYENQKSSV